MIEQFKKILYFPIASYFRFFAAICLKRWHPKIVVVTGSSGKTTLLHLLEAQIGGVAKYSHHANSSYGIPFDILGLHRKSLFKSEWIGLFFKAPFAVFKKVPKENIYIVEVDTDRPGEGKFLAELLKPEIVLWVSLGITHGMNFDILVKEKKFLSVEESIAYDYGYLLENCSGTVVINADEPLEEKQIKRTKAKIVKISQKTFLDIYEITNKKTNFKIRNQRYSFDALLPEEMFYSIAMCREAVEELDLPFDSSFIHFILPPGRSSFFEGIKNTVLIDGSYNANLLSAKALLTMFSKYPAKHKWVVIGDMLELGNLEKEEHEKLAEILAKMQLEKIILFGQLTEKYVAKKLEELDVDPKKIIFFQSLEGLDTYLSNTIKGGEAILFKGSQSMFLEAIIEHLLKNKHDISQLPRRGKFWDEKRTKMLA